MYINNSIIIFLIFIYIIKKIHLQVYFLPLLHKFYTLAITCVPLKIKAQ